MLFAPARVHGKDHALQFWHPPMACGVFCAPLPRSGISISSSIAEGGRRSRGGTPHADVCRLREAARTDLVSVRVRDVLVQYPADHATSLRQMRRSDRSPGRGLPGLYRSGPHHRSGTFRWPLRGQSPHHHSCHEVSRASLSDFAPCRAHEDVWPQNPERDGCAGTRSTSSMETAFTRVQSVG